MASNRDEGYIEFLKTGETCIPKGRLIEIACSLERAGGKREARSLRTIIRRLDEWQNK